MDEAQFLTIFQKTIMLIMVTSAPILLSAIIIGLSVSIIQSVTQIQEQTLTFVPKIFGALLVLVVSAPWMIDMFTTNVKELFQYMKLLDQLIKANTFHHIHFFQSFLFSKSDLKYQMLLMFSALQ